MNGKKVSAAPVAGKYLCINREWANGDRVELTLPMSLSMRTWQVNKNSVSVDYGPLTLSLKIAEKYVEKDSRETAIGDSKWQKGADSKNGLLLKSIRIAPGIIHWYWIRKNL